MTGILRMGQLTERSGYQGGPQLPIFKAERHAAVPMVFLRTLANMACSRGRGPANRLAGMIVLPDSAVSRNQKGKRRGGTGYQTAGLDDMRRCGGFDWGRRKTR